MFRLLRGVEELKCRECGKTYPFSECREVMNLVNTEGVGFPSYDDLVLCLVCFRKKYPKGV